MPDRRTPSAAYWRDRAIIVAGLVLVSALAWLYMVDMHLGMHDMHAEMGHAHVHPWGVAEFVFAFVMWSVMMVGMMLPSASPMVLTLSGLTRRRTPATHLRSTAAFVGGYLLVWVGYSAVAAVAQWSFHQAALVSHHGVATSPWLAAGLLLVAGTFQLTPLKYACLDRCRTPLGFLLHEWRPGPRGALVMGLRHGANCAACCWAWMALMFVLGVMNIWWMLALTIFGLVEKIAPAPLWTGRAAGVLMIGWGIVAVLGA